MPVLGDRISTTRSGAPWTPSALILSLSQTTIKSGTKWSVSVRNTFSPSPKGMQGFPLR